MAKLKLIKVWESSPHELDFGVELGLIQIQDEIRAYHGYDIGPSLTVQRPTGLTAFPMQCIKKSPRSSTS